MKAKLDDMGALDIFRGIVQEPVNTEESPVRPKELAQYQEWNHAVYMEIIKHLDAENLEYVAQTLANTNLLSGYLVRQLLKAKYAGDDYVAFKDAALKSFLDLEYHGSATQFIAKVCAANLCLISVKAGLDDQVKKFILLHKLPSSFQLFRDVISVGCINDTIPMVLERLEKHVSLNQLDGAPCTSTQHVFLTANE